MTEMSFFFPMYLDTVVRKNRGRKGSDHYPDMERVGTKAIPLPVNGNDDSNHASDDY